MLIYQKRYIVASCNRITNLSIMLDNVGKNNGFLVRLLSFYLFTVCRFSSSSRTFICDEILGALRVAIAWIRRLLSELSSEIPELEAPARAIASWCDTQKPILFYLFSRGFRSRGALKNVTRSFRGAFYLSTVIAWTLPLSKQIFVCSVAIHKYEYRPDKVSRRKIRVTTVNRIEFIKRITGRVQWRGDRERRLRLKIGIILL